MIAALLKYFPAVFTALAKTLGLSYDLALVGVPVGTAPNATWNNTTGAFTLGTALQATYSGGIWLRFAGVGINGSTGGPAASGIYWCVMSSPTAGQAYNVVGDPAAAGGFQPYIPSLPNQLATTAGTHVQSTAALISLASVPLPGGSMGNNGSLEVFPVWTHNNSGTGKALHIILGAQAFAAWTNTTTTLETRPGRIRNRGMQTKQISTAYLGYAAAAQSAGYYSIDTAANQMVVLGAYPTTSGTDYAILEACTVRVGPSS